MRNLSGRTAAITGAGSGIGRSLAVELARRDCVLALADNNAQTLDQTRLHIEQLGARCSVHPLDVADRAAVEGFAAAVVEHHGGVEMLFNNAGVTLIDSVESMHYEDFNWLMNINFWGVVYATKAFLPYLRQADEAHIVNVSSLFGLLSFPLQGAYNASKFAVRGFTEALKMELAGTRVGVSCVHPGGIKTDIVRNARMGDGFRNGTKETFASEFQTAARTTPAQAATQIIRGIRKNRRRIVIGAEARFADWVVRLFPSSYERILGFRRKLSNVLATVESENKGASH